MSRHLSVVLLLVIFAPAVLTAQDTDSKQTLKTDQEKFSYAVGMDMGASAKRLGEDLDVDALTQGVKDALEGKRTLLAEEELNSIKTEFGRKMREKQMAQREADSKKNAEKGKAFLTKNKERPEVKSTGSGLQYEVLQEGSGANPKPTDKVTVHYRGTTLDGVEFDSSYSRNQPATFPLNRVIAGWTEGVQLMKPGAKYKFYIPSELAYGAHGSPPKIGPNETLIFEVELLSIGE